MQRRVGIQGVSISMVQPSKRSAILRDKKKKVEYLQSDCIVGRFVLVKVDFGNSIYLRLAKFELDSSE